MNAKLMRIQVIVYIWGRWITRPSPVAIAGSWLSVTLVVGESRDRKVEEDLGVEWQALRFPKEPHLSEQLMVGAEVAVVAVVDSMRVDHTHTAVGSRTRTLGIAVDNYFVRA